jgi:DNA-binding transcriptional LysR family regulator
MEHVFRENGVSFRVSMEVSSTETIKQAVMAGMGISFISLHTIGLELNTQKLVVLDVAGLPIVRDWFVIHLREKRLWPIAAAFRAFLLERGADIIREAVGLDSATVVGTATAAANTGPIKAKARPRKQK